jgi:hypothetical protein
MLGGVRGRGLAAPSYSIRCGLFFWESPFEVYDLSYKNGGPAAESG